MGKENCEPLMSLLSLKKHHDSPEELSVSQRAISLLLQGIAGHAIEVDRAEYENFRSGVNRLQALLREAASDEELLVITGRAIQALAENGRNTTNVIRERTLILESMLSMLIQTVIAFGEPDDHSAKRLTEIQTRFAKLGTTEQCRELRANLRESLDEMGQACARRKMEELEVLANAHRRTNEDGHRLDGIEAADSVTGLPSQSAALAVLDETLKAPQRFFAAVTVFSRFQAVNARFGHDVGERVFKSVSERFRSKLGSRDHLFRWRGPAMVAVLERDQPIQNVQAEIKKLCRSFAEEMFEVRRRVMIPMPASWLVIPVDTSRLEIVKLINQFVASQTQEHVASVSV